LKRILAAFLCLALAAPAAALAQNSSVPLAADASSKATETAPSVRLSQVVIDMGHGDIWGTTSLWACWTKFPLVWGSSEDPWFETPPGTGVPAPDGDRRRQG
jgi:hypothetical protein